MATHRRFRSSDAPKRDSAALLDGIVADAVEAAADELVEGDALDGEHWVSALVGVLQETAATEHLPSLVAGFGTALERRVASSPDATARGLSAVFGTLVPEGAGASPPRTGGGDLPRWARLDPAPTPKAAYRVDAAGGDQTGLTLVYDESPTCRRHAVGALVDHNLRGSLLDAFVTDDVDDVLAELRTIEQDQAGSVTEVGADEGRRLLGNALWMTQDEPGGISALDADLHQLAGLLRRRVGEHFVAPARDAPATVEAAIDRVLTSVPAEDGEARQAGHEFLQTLAEGSGLPFRASPLAFLLALFDGVATRRWATSELDALERAVPFIVDAIARAVSGGDEEQAEVVGATVSEAFDDVWGDARELLARGERLAPDRRSVLDCIVVDDDEVDDEDLDDDEDEDEDGWSADPDLSFPVVDLGARPRPGLGH